MDITCTKCGSRHVGKRLDKRDCYEAYCIDCNSYIKKLSTKELVEMYEEELGGLKATMPSDQPVRIVRPLCKWCTERWGVNQGMGFRRIPIKYCPMCGRERTEEDTKY